MDEGGKAPRQRQSTGATGARNDETTEESEDSDGSESFSDDSDRATPVPGEGLLGQIFFLQKKELENNMGLSMREPKSKPLQKNTDTNKLGKS